MLTKEEVHRLLVVTTKHPRDHMLLSVALGAGLRIGELVALDCGDVLDDDCQVKPRFHLRRKTTKFGRGGLVVIAPRLMAKLQRYVTWKMLQHESLEARAPLFVSRESGRMTIRLAQHVFHKWQLACGWRQRHKFHALRHTFCTNVLDETGNLRLVQMAARHASIMTTVIYTHPTQDQLANALAQIPC